MIRRPNQSDNRSARNEQRPASQTLRESNYSFKRLRVMVNSGLRFSRS
jgi:hypothetical protein